MSDNSKIEWLGPNGKTFNGWTGCQKVSEGCRNCYAERWSKRAGREWGPGALRVVAADSTAAKPHRWNREALVTGERIPVFPSLMDPFDLAAPSRGRDLLWETIRKTPALTWILLTKRPQNAPDLLPTDWSEGWDHVILGVSAEDQPTLFARTVLLSKIPAKKRLLSAEPLLGPLDLDVEVEDPTLGCRMPAKAFYDWVIVGGESGKRARSMSIDWARSIRDACAGVTPFFFKQWGEYNAAGERVGRKRAGRVLDGRIHDEVIW